MLLSLTLHDVLKRVVEGLYGVQDAVVEVSVQENPKFGEYSSNVALGLAKRLGKKPQEVGKQIIERFKDLKGLNKPVDGSDHSLQDIVDRVELAGAGFLNFYLKDEYLAVVLNDIISAGDRFGSSDIGAGKTVIVEHTSPNTNKPLHLGHLRNNFIGMSLVNMYRLQGYNVLSTEIVNDRGIHICKSMLGYLKWGQGKTPESEGIKSDFFVGEYYVLYNQEEKKNPGIIEEVRELLRKWEEGDLETRALWKTMNTWAQDGYRVTYDKIGSRFDFRTYESEIYDKGKQVVLEAFQEGKVERVEGGALAVDLSEQGLGGREDGKKILVRSDGTAMYVTQDIYLAKKRWEEYHPERVLYVVADEQIYHFKVLFAVLEQLGFDWMKNRYVHIPYGMVRLPEGKMKSREGTVVDADTLIAEVEKLASEEIVKRNPTLSEGEVAERAGAVALGAIKFFFLKVSAPSTFVYHPKESLDFEGNTGPYVQYTYARLASILRKNEEPVGPAESRELPPLERGVLRELLMFPETLCRAAVEYRPHHIAEYVFTLAQGLNSFYHAAPVLQEKDKKLKDLRLNILSAALVILRNCMVLLGIPVLEEM